MYLYLTIFEDILIIDHTPRFRLKTSQKDNDDDYDYLDKYLSGFGVLIFMFY